MPRRCSLKGESILLIIGEKLNSAIPRVREAILNKDTAFVHDLARRQTENGAAYLDVNTAQGHDESSDMEWMINIIQEVTDVPLCIDSVDPAVVKRALALHRGTAMLNSISMEKARITGMIPLIQEYGCKVIGLTMDDQGIPKTAEERLRITGQLVELLEQHNIPLEDLYLDPLVLPVAVNSANGTIFFQCLAEIKKLYSVKTVSGLSNVSHSLPNRKLINRYFLALCLQNGMDAAILDPLDRKLVSALLTTNLLLNQDPFARKYLKAYRAENLED